MRWTLFVTAGLLLLAVGCSGRKVEAQRDLTERQRDSILAQSRLPGAGAVGQALNAADREASRATTLNSQVDSLPR
jgi:hypothetical protein